MNVDLVRYVTRELDVAVPSEVETVAAYLADELSGVAVLYYGSTLRTGDFDGVMDFYVLTDGLAGSFLRRIGMRYLWPDVSYHEFVVGGRRVRAKVATMPIATFERAARGKLIDTTVWTRFVQPAALVWRADPLVGRRVVRAVADAMITAARFAAVVGPVTGTPREFWLPLFRETYRAELRVEPPGREATILQHDPDRYARLLPIAWRAGGVAFRTKGAALEPQLTFNLCHDTAQAWMVRADAGKVLNIARLIKAAFTFDGAARYGLWKVQRHTGVVVELTPWRERHPILASVPVLWQVMHSRAS
jgi:hypothetical protein